VSVGAAAGLSLPVIGALLGHSQPGTTARYAHLSTDPLRAAFDIVANHIAAAMHESVWTVDEVLRAAGTTSIFTCLLLERAFPDVHVAWRHGAALPTHFESAGKVLPGLAPGDPGW